MVQPLRALSNVSRSSGRFAKCESRSLEAPSRRRRLWICASDALMTDDSVQMALMVLCALLYLSRRSLSDFAVVRTQLVMLTCRRCLSAPHPGPLVWGSDQPAYH